MLVVSGFFALTDKADLSEAGNLNGAFLNAFLVQETCIPAQVAALLLAIIPVHWPPV
jgi:hypothetical protein